MLDEIEGVKKIKIFTANCLFEIYKFGEIIRLDYESLIDTLTEYEEIFHLDEIMGYRNKAKSELGDNQSINAFVNQIVKVTFIEKSKCFM